MLWPWDLLVTFYRELQSPSKGLSLRVLSFLSHTFSLPSFMEVVISPSLRQTEHAPPKLWCRSGLVAACLHGCGDPSNVQNRHSPIGLWSGSCGGDSASKPPTVRAKVSGSSGGRQHGHLNKTLWDLSSSCPLTQSWPIKQNKDFNGPLVSACRLNNLHNLSLIIIRSPLIATNLKIVT